MTLTLTLPIFCSPLTEFVLVLSSDYMTDLNSLDQYIRDQEQEENRLQRGIFRTCYTINVILTIRVGSMNLEQGCH